MKGRAAFASEALLQYQVSVECNSSSHNPETILFTTYPHDGILN